MKKRVPKLPNPITLLRYNPWRPLNQPPKQGPVRTFRRGANPRAAKVTDEYVRCIRRAYAAGSDLKSLTVQFPKLKAAGIRAIIKRQSWKHVVP